MGDIPAQPTPFAGQQRPSSAQDAPKTANDSPASVAATTQSGPFYSQYNSVNQLHPRLDIARGSLPQPNIAVTAPPTGTDNNTTTYDMTGMANALPEYGQMLPPHMQQQSGGRPLSGASTPALVYQLQQNLHYTGQPSPQFQSQSFNPAVYGQGQPYGQPYMHQQGLPPGQYGMMPPNQQRAAHGYHNYQQPQQYMYYPSPYIPQPHSMQHYGVQLQPQPGHTQSRRLSMPTAQQPIVTPNAEPLMLGGNYMQTFSSSGLSGDPSRHGGQLAHSPLHGYPRPSFENNVESIPRGPPRKPKQSGHALWVGNLPPGTTITDLKDHFSRDATKEIESLFFISKSNCAFVNYRSEAACTAAMHRFHDSRFHGVRLVCRLRRSSTAASGIPTGPSAMMIPRAQSTSPQRSSPKSDGGDAIESDGTAEDNEPVEETGPPKEPLKQGRVSEKFFIVKSLTLQDLEVSVRNGIWATQSHNEETLNTAYENADNVYLIFSANKSGEYFGIARMTSPIMENATEIINLFPRTTVLDASDAPKSIPTPATEFAPRGKIIDDSARGTIFWEADLSESEEEIAKAVEESAIDADGPAGSQSWGKPFRIEWVSTTRLPFYRTRGLRNPWNANREVKIARDGTELETNVGRRLVQMFHRLGPSNATGSSPTGMPIHGMAPPY